MKKECIFLFLWALFCFLLLAGTLNAQDISGQYTEKATTHTGFDANSGVQIGSIVVEGKTFTTFKTKSGSLYVKGQKSDGGVYPIWVGDPTGETYQGQQVRLFNSGTRCYLKLNSKGYPRAVYLTSKTK
jgi:hypothetical protein